ncbi:MAG TPA: SUMF1/EgtB/PvdO family nonheme iron enzyme [Phycisphaerae bacterium]|nr:SUMF1/EgtB/PvdO family nonheme iron enzyme [Phycisphaerae bacterium]
MLPGRPAVRTSPSGRPVSGEYQPAERQALEAEPVQRLYQQHRFGVLVTERHRWAEDEEGRNVCGLAERRLEEEMALVPAGSVSMPTTLEDLPGSPEIDVEVGPFLLAIHTVTNECYQQFVDAGCYDELALWPEAIWPHLIELHDLTGTPGPRYWMDSRHDQRLADHPVVGVSWYEAVAYAKWVGLRLPTEAEWQMAASWRIKSEADVFRRLPWGDAMDYQRCNVWGTGRGAVAPVNAFPSGAAPNGVQQLIGNVWEWTASDFEVSDAKGRVVIGEMPMRSVRGGAYDTYFDTQATASFRTGQILLARAHNTGFRCALNV